VTKKLPHPFNWYYKSFAIDGKCPFCKSDHIYCSLDNDVVFCRGYGCYVSVYDCEGSIGNIHEEGSGACKGCSWEPSIFCPLEKTSISIGDCREAQERVRFCKKCESIEILLASQSELTTDLVYVCDDCDKGVDFAKLKEFKKWE
jgi:hypothetical protein